MNHPKRRILFLPAWYPSETFPISGIFIEHQAIALSHHYHVAVLAPWLASWRHVLTGQMGRQSWVEMRAGLCVYRERAMSWVPRATRRAYTSYAQAARRGLERILAEWGKPDLIHAHIASPAGWAGVQLKQWFELPVVLTEHSSPFSLNFRTAAQKQMVRETLARVDRLVTVSPDLARQVRDFYPGIETTTVGNIINTEFFAPAEGEEQIDSAPATRFLAIGLLTKQKGIIYLLEAARLLTQRGHSSFQVIVGGDGPERSMLEKKAQEFGIANRCQFLGALEPAAVRDWMRRCHIFVLPSLHETFGVVLGEAQSCGKPVIATRCGGAEYVVTPETGVLVPVADAAALGDAMEAFLTKRIQFDSRHVRQSVMERFGEAAFVRSISAVYEDVGVGMS